MDAPSATGISATTVAAIIGAITGPASLVWTIIRDRNDRGKLNVECSIAMAISGDPSFAGTEPTRVLLWKVTNVGRRPVHVVSVGGTLKAGVDRVFLLLNTRNLPHTLQPGEVVYESSDRSWHLIHNLATLYARDSLDRVYKAPRKQVEAIRRDGTTSPKLKGSTQLHF
jgi:hypothetical protein